jgi:anaerobic magnesium-protoporphyrin IX monomethyl ester cyclase
MARIVYVQNIFREYPAYMALAAEMKRCGYYTAVVVARAERDVVSAVLEHRPDLVGFSPTVYDIEWCLAIAMKLKAIGLEIILGGAMITANQDMINNLSVDFLCIGEGEQCLRELLDKKDRKYDSGSYKTVPNLVYKKNGDVFANPLAPMIKDLDDLAMPDHGLYEKYPQIVKGPTGIFTFMRGCRFRCSFCFNHVFQKIYRNKPFIVRRRSPESSVKEIEETIAARNGSLRIVRLFDSSLLSDMKWAKEFLGLYRERIRIPFVCFAHPSEINDEISKELKKSGCVEIGFSIESGSSSIRNKVLCKRSSERQIYAAAEALRRNHVPFVSFNMLGSPGETWEDVLSTIEMNRRIKPKLAWGSLTQVYHGTDLERITKKLEVQRIGPKRTCGVLDYSHPNQKRILTLLDAFPFIIRYPKISRRVLNGDFSAIRPTLRLLSILSFFMQCLRPALSFKEFIRHYIVEEGGGVGYY